MASDVALSLKLDTANLSERALQVLRAHIVSDKDPSEFTVEDIVRIKKQSLNRRASYAEIALFLRNLGLRLGMTSHELEFFRIHGRLPAGHEGMTGETDVESLDLSVRATNVLKHQGIERLGDHRNVSLEELLKRAPNAGPETVREIGTAFKNTGFPLYETRAERLCKEGLSSHED
jgi:DNA-directed RNA polymerase alpha subunit